MEENMLMEVRDLAKKLDIIVENQQSMLLDHDKRITKLEKIVAYGFGFIGAIKLFIDYFPGFK